MENLSKHFMDLSLCLANFLFKKQICELSKR